MKKIIILIAIIILTQPLFASQVVLDNVIPTWDDGGHLKLFSKAQTTFYFRFINDEPTDELAFTNGFVVWTTDGSTFGPAVIDTLPIDFGGGNGWNDVFDLIVNLPHFSADGIGVDSVGIVVIASLGALSVPAGFNEVSISIATGLLQGPTTLCIDTAYLPNSIFWRWGNSTPSWGGPYCFEVDVLGMPSIFTNCPGTLNLPYADTIRYNFNAEHFPLDQDTNAISYTLLNGKGAIDYSSGQWQYDATPADIGQSFQLNIRSKTPGNWPGHCNTTIQIGHPALGDFDLSGQTDIDDIVMMIEYMFGSGDNPPEFLEMLDCDGSGQTDIDDIILLINYMFGTGEPPPVDPWG